MSWRSRSQRGQTELVWTVQIGHVEKDSGVLWGGRMAKLQAAGRRPRRKSREELHGRGERWGQSVRLPAKTPFSANPDWNLEWIFCSVNSHKPHRSHFFCKMDLDRFWTFWHLDSPVAQCEQLPNTPMGFDIWVNTEVQSEQSQI